MDNKRKATSSTGAGAADGDDRAAKRRKVPGPTTDYDLSKGETNESTTSYGLHFLEMIRRTKDKSGRTVADYFENLLPREGNEDYYRRIRMPISLKTIEKKLHNQDFANLAELESYFKRMVTNAKEYYHKGSEVFEDAERVRKALSNYMTKTNPAYKLIPGYSCQAAPIPEDSGAVPDDAGNDDDVDAEGDDDDAEGEEDAEAEDDEDDDDAEDSSTHTRKIIIKRKTPSRPIRQGSTPVRKTEGRSRAKADHEYEGIPYKGLTFQEAQEKIVEELIRKPDGSDPYFLDFINLPPRSYKDYYAVIQEPLSLKMLQKSIRGIQGRQPATGVSDFKSWDALEGKAKLLWSNAHFYNEEGSLIYQLATELKECFERELKEAKAAVQEPPQPKIKLKVQPGQETPVTGAKRITIHVKDSKSSGAPSPAPPTGQSSESSRADGGQDVSRSFSSTAGTPGLLQHAQLDKARSLSLSGASPSPSLGPAGQNGSAQPSPAMLPRANGNVPLMNGVAASGQHPQFAHGVPGQNGHHQAPPPPPPIWDKQLRAPGRGLSDALMPNLLIRTLYGVPVPPERRFRLEIPAHPKLAQRNFTVHIPAGQHKLQIIPTLAPLDQQQRQHRLFVTINGHMVSRGTPTPAPDDPIPPNALVFEVNLQPGTNLIAITVLAALPRGQKLPSGTDCELEKVTINAFLSKV
ncbi:hypothetical protein OQA88_3974 [Cercophora sp. LCS_1]